MKFTTLSAFAICAYAETIQIVDDEHVNLSLYYWVDRAFAERRIKLNFRPRFESKKIPLVGE